MNKRIFVLFFLLLLIASASATITINSPTEKNYFEGSPGEELNISFKYSYPCPNAYAIDVFQDTDFSNSICSKRVVGMGWQVSHGYGGDVCQLSSGYSTSIQDNCIIASDAVDGSYTVQVSLFNSAGNVKDYARKTGAVKIISLNPDLSLSLAEEEEESEMEFDAGNILSFSVEVENYGLKDAENVFVQAFLYSSSHSRELIQEKNFPVIPAGDIGEMNVEIASSNLMPGTYFVELIADPQNTVLEQNENNNYLQFSFYLHPNPDVTYIEKPDLIVEDFSAERTVYLIVENIEFKGVIANEGFADAESFTVSLLGPYNDVLAEKEIALLEPNEVEEVSFELVPPYSGFVEFTLSIDDQNEVEEIVETNNDSSITILVNGKKSDLIIKSLTHLIDADNTILLPIRNPVEEIDEYFFRSESLPSHFIFPVEFDTALGIDDTYVNVFSKSDLCIEINGENFYSAKLVFGALSEIQSLTPPINDYLEFIEKYGTFKAYSLIVDNKYEELSRDYQAKLVFKGNLVSWHGRDYSGFYFDPKALKMGPGSYKMRVVVDCFERVDDAIRENNTIEIKLNFTPKEEKEFPPETKLKEEKLIEVDYESLSKYFIIELMEKQIKVNETQLISLAYPNVGVQSGKKVTVKYPSEKVDELVSDREGMIKFTPTEAGIYRITVETGRVQLESEFKVVSEEEASSRGLIESLFGERSGKEFILSILLIILSIVVGFLAYAKIGTILKKGESKAVFELMRIAISVLFFIAPIALNNFRGFEFGIGFVIVEFILIFLAVYLIKEKHRRLKEKFILKI
ncbi:MAG: CARDB domain-containing protein [archaeon]